MSRSEVEQNLFLSIHKGIVSVPHYVCLLSTYDLFEYVNDQDGAVTSEI